MITFSQFLGIQYQFSFNARIYSTKKSTLKMNFNKLVHYKILLQQRRMYQKTTYKNDNLDIQVNVYTLIYCKGVDLNITLQIVACCSKMSWTNREVLWVFSISLSHNTFDYSCVEIVSFQTTQPNCCLCCCLDQFSVVNLLRPE